MFGTFQAEPEEAARSSGFMKGLLLVGGAFGCLFKTEWLIAAFPLITAFYGVMIPSGVSKRIFLNDCRASLTVLA